MKFLAIVIVLLCRKLDILPTLEGIKGAVQEGVYKLSGAPLKGWLLYALVVLVPGLLVNLLYVYLGPWIFGLLGLLFSVTLFFLLWGGRPIEEFLDRYLPAWQSGQLEAPDEIGRQYFSLTEPASLQDVHQQVWNQWLLTWNAQVFAPLLWFWFFGPLLLVWMLVNRALIALSDRIDPDLAQAGSQVQQFFFWVSGRILALTFMVTGSFSAVAKKAGEGFLDWDIATGELLHDTASTALGRQPLKDDTQSLLYQGERELTALQKLLKHSLILWLVIMAIWTIFYA